MREKNFYLLKGTRNDFVVDYIDKLTASCATGVITALCEEDARGRAKENDTTLTHRAHFELFTV